jgi:hypothetical protein
VESKKYNDILNDIIHGKATLSEVEREACAWDLSVLSPIKTQLLKDHSIDVVERLENIVKNVLRRYLSGIVSGAEARQIAGFQKEVGLLLKYKSYAIKAASPLGFSIFIQSPGQGFSFQQHVTHKTEVFHILQPLQNALVFICPYEEWSRCYDESSFQNWMHGKRDERYDRFAIVPRPGDVFLIDRLSTVHTVIGCILEEYATISTDMVDRLHDQNAGCKIPDGHQQSERIGDKSFAASLFVSSGRGHVLIGEEREFRNAKPPEIPVSGGDVLLIPAGISYQAINESADILRFSLQRINVDIAFPRNLDEIQH